MQNRKTWLILGSVVVAAVIGFVALRGVYPPRTNVEGAIGGADRYQSTQITDTDVVLKDAEVQAFLQSDLFHRMSTDADFARIVRRHHDYFSQVAGNEAFSQVSTSESFADVSVNEDYRRLLGVKEFRDFVANGGAMEFARRKDSSQLLEAARTKGVTTEAAFAGLSEFARIKSDLAVEAARVLPILGSKAEFQRLGLNPKYMEMINMKGFAELMHSEAYASVGPLDEFARVLKKRDFVDAMNTEAFRKISKAGLLENYVVMTE